MRTTTHPVCLTLAVLVLFSLCGCSGTSWAGRYYALDGAWEANEAPPLGFVLTVAEVEGGYMLTFDQDEQKLAAKLKDGDALYAETDLEKAGFPSGCLFPRQGINGRGIPSISGTTKVAGRVRIQVGEGVAGTLTVMLNELEADEQLIAFRVARAPDAE
jgi:hypothetical protein